MEQAKQADYRSPEFYKILSTVNDVLIKYNIKPITAEQGTISQSRFNTGKYGSKYMWRITHKDYPELLNGQLMSDIKSTLTRIFPKYIDSKIITIGNPIYTKDASHNPMASVVIMVTELQDNIITREDLLAFKQGNPDAVKKCLEIESRMYKHAKDARDAATRIEDFAYSMIYEPKLETVKLKGINYLMLKHQTEVVTLETDNKTDFKGTINGNDYNIEGKSTKAQISYTNDFDSNFADYINKRLAAKSLGSIHDADYVLLVLKQTGDVICFNAHNTKENWLAGNINM